MLLSLKRFFILDKLHQQKRIILFALACTIFANTSNNGNRLEYINIIFINVYIN